MSWSDEDILLKSILSMDAYNRGYDPGILGLGGANSAIGNITISSDTSTEIDGSVAEDAGLYGVAYDLGGGQKSIHIGVGRSMKFSPKLIEKHIETI